MQTPDDSLDTFLCSKLQDSEILGEVSAQQKTEKEILRELLSKAYDKVFPPNRINTAILKTATIETFLEELKPYYETK